ncbi:thiamine phosphate synthase [Sabulicella glaciei]|uniref:Thiamine phosphate synthase n=1 Tax=Sabulicella glaciei TaxID=2984948 RepID=A0ABT3P032_9PROT|nr:thiamine phosphate synthase [Roseococcus sp. MDT2-1-1]
MPRIWLLTDRARLPDPTKLLRRLPRGAAVLLRDMDREGAIRVARLCRTRRLRVMVQEDGRLALAARAGLHVPDRRGARHLLPFLLNRRGRLLTVAVHGRAGLARARRLHADAALVSPAFPTRSHPGAPALGPLRWRALTRALPCPAIALGGMDAGRSRQLGPRAAGWAAIDAWGCRRGLCSLRHSV